MPGGRRGGTTILEALCLYLQQTPAARDGLADPARCARLLHQLRTAGPRGAPKHENPMYIGKSGDVRHAMDAVVADRARLYRGRPVAGEPFPSADELAELTRHRIASHLQSVATPELLAGMAADWQARTPWPFGTLLDRTP